MKGKNFRILAFLILSVSFLVTRPVLPYSYTAWTGMTGAKTLAINPFIYGPLSPLSGVSIDAVMGLGISSQFDILADLATVNIYDPVSYGGSWILPRFDLGGANIVGLQLGTDTTAFYLIPQYHLFKENDRLAFEFNVTFKVPLTNPSVMTLSGVVAPVIKIVPGVFHFYVEADPSYAFDSAGVFSLNIVPGVCLMPNAENQISLGVILGNVTQSVSPSLGIWYWHAISL